MELELKDYSEYNDLDISRLNGYFEALSALERYRYGGTSRAEFTQQANYFVGELVNDFLTELFGNCNVDIKRLVREYAGRSIGPIVDCYQNECFTIDVKALFEDRIA